MIVRAMSSPGANSWLQAATYQHLRMNMIRAPLEV